MGIGPSSKETTLHHFRDPLTEILANDSGIDFLGVLVQGTPENCAHKQFVAERSGVFAEMMRADGVIVSIDSWGNSHVDFAAAIQAVGERNIPVVGLTFLGNQAAFVVTNPYMESIIDFNKNALGIETTMVGENTAVELDAVKALSILTSKMRKRRQGREKSVIQEICLRKLRHKTFPISRVELSSHTSISGRTLFLDSGDLAEFAGRYPELEAVRLSLIRPGETDLYINSILDFSPIAVKVSGQAGTGVTNILSGVRVMLTGVETGGFQPANIGSSEGFFKDKVKLNRCGTPGENETILHFDMLLAEGQGRTRQGIMAAHRAADEVVQKIREELKGVNGALAGENREFFDVSRTGGYRVLLIKLVSGLGCLYDTALFPTEPGGFLGSRSIMELSNNMQVALTPNEYRDGMVHSLC